MMIPEVRVETVAGYCRIDTPLDDADRQVLENIIMPAAKAHMVTYTGQKEEELDKHAELTIAYLALCSFLYVTANNIRGSYIDESESTKSFVDSLTKTIVKRIESDV